jgi:hypothetical protein
MRSTRYFVVLAALAAASLGAMGSVRADSLEACRGGYPQLLMTAAECRGYLAQLAALRARGDRSGELELLEWHTALLIQRAEACPCQQGRAFPLTTRAAAVTTAMRWGGGE